MSAPRCTFKIGGIHRCNGILVERQDRIIGRVLWVCPQCARFRAGICQECPRPVDGVVGKSRRCADCRSAYARRKGRHYWHQNKPTLEIRRKRRFRAFRKRVPALTPHEVGLRGGVARAAALTPEQRSEIARKGGAANAARYRALKAAA